MEHLHRVQQLTRKHLHKLDTQPPKPVLLDEFVQVGRKALKNEAEVFAVDEVGSHAEDVVFVVGVALVVEL